MGTRLLYWIFTGPSFAHVCSPCGSMHSLPCHCLLGTQDKPMYCHPELLGAPPPTDVTNVQDTPLLYLSLHRFHGDAAKLAKVAVSCLTSKPSGNPLWVANPQLPSFCQAYRMAELSHHFWGLWPQFCWGWGSYPSGGWRLALCGFEYCSFYCILRFLGSLPRADCHPHDCTLL
jgi:hypothetical protein